MLSRLLLLSVLVFASVPLVTAEQSLDAGTKYGLERDARQVSIQTTFNQSLGLLLMNDNVTLVVLTTPSSRSLEVTPNQQLQYGSNTVVLLFMNGTLIEQISDSIMILYDQGSSSIIPYFGSAPTPLLGPGTLYYDSNSAFFSRSPGLTNFTNAQINQYPYSGVLFEVSLDTQGAMQVLRLTVQNDENPPNMPHDVMQITGSTSLPVSNLQSVTYQSNTISINQGGQQIQSFPNINTLTTYTTVTGTIPINETFMGSANVGNTNNPRGFTGPGQLIVGAQRAFYTTDGGVINSIQDSMVSQTVCFMPVVTDGVTTELNLQDHLNMNQQMIQLINSIAIPLTGVTSYEIDDQDVIFRDSNNNEVIRATGRDRFNTYFNNQASSFALPGSDRTQQLQGSTSGTLYSNSDTGEVFYSNDQFLNQRIDQMLRQATDTPPASITSVQYSTNPQGIGSLVVNGMSVVTLSGAQIVDIGQTESIAYSNRMITIRGGPMERTFSNIDQTSSIAPPGTFLVFNMSADLSLHGPGRLYINGPNAFFTNDNNLIRSNSEFVQNIQPPSIRTSSTIDEDGQTAVMLEIGGEPYMTLSNGSLITPNSDEVLLYADNKISFVRAPVRVPQGATVSYNENTISFGASNISGIRNLALLNGRLSVFDTRAPEVFPGGGDIYFNPVTGLAAYTITGDISTVAADTIDMNARTRPPIDNITRLGVFDNNQFVMYEGLSRRMIPGGGFLFTSGRTGFYSTDSTVGQEIVRSSSQLNPVMPSFMNGQIEVVYNNVSIYEFNPGSATRDITLQNKDVITYENGVLFNARNPNISFEVSSVTNFNGINGQQFGSSSIPRNFTGPGTLLIDTQSGMAFFTNVPRTANLIRDARRQVVDTSRPPMIERPPTPSFASKYPTPIAQFGQAVSVYEGARLTLECRVSVGNPRPTITFFRDGVPIDRNDTSYMIENGNLTIISAMLNDTRRYTCRAQNDLGIEEASTNLTVRRGAPTGPPQSFTVTPRVRNMTFSWSPPASTMQHGMITGYFLSCVSVSGGNTISMQYTTADTFTLGGFAPATSYNCSIFASNSQGSGPATYMMVTTADDAMLFQLQLSGTGLRDCQEWVGVATSEKLTDITNAVIQNINQLCQCGLSVEYITESAFQCFANSEQQVTFRARLHGTAQVTSSQLIAYLGNFVFQTDSTIAVQGLRLDVDSSCSIAINTFGDPQCATTTTTSESTTTEAALSDNTAATIGGVVAVIVVVIVVVAVTVIVIAIAVIKSRRASLSLYQDARNKPTTWSNVARSEGEDITTTQCEAYELTKLDHKYEDLSEYQNPSTEYEIPTTQCPAYISTSKSGK